MKRKKWLIPVCVAVGLLILCVGVYAAPKWSGGDTGAPSEAVLKESGAPDRSDTAQTGADLPDGSFEAVSVWVDGSGSAGDDFYLAALLRFAVADTRQLDTLLAAIKLYGDSQTSVELGAYFEQKDVPLPK